LLQRSSKEIAPNEKTLATQEEAAGYTRAEVNDIFYFPLNVPKCIVGGGTMVACK
jgi:hypothetical protein